MFQLPIKTYRFPIGTYRLVVPFEVGPRYMFTVGQVLNPFSNKKNICGGIPFVGSLQMDSSAIVIKFFNSYDSKIIKTLNLNTKLLNA